MARRQIVQIDAEKCNGCGLCVSACAEGAIQLIDGKARLVSDTYCDGLGACLGKCPQDAIAIVERDALAFDESAVQAHLECDKTANHSAASAKQSNLPAACPSSPCGCPGTAVQQFARNGKLPVVSGIASATTGSPMETASDDPPLCHWPIQLRLVPPTAPFLQNAELFLAADCVAFACDDFHRNVLQHRPLLIGCPKLDDGQAYTEKLTDILRHNAIKRLTVVHMEVPCCAQLLRIAAAAIQRSGASTPLSEITVTRRGEIMAETA